MAVNGIEMEVGQVWRTRNGDTVTIVGNDGDENWPWDLDNNVSVGDDGLVFGGDRRDINDLVSLVQPAAPVAKPPIPRIVVGQTWRTRCGDTVEIMDEDQDDTYPFALSNSATVTNDGCAWCGGQENDHDLIELLTQQQADALPVQMFDKPQTAPDLLRAAAGHIQDRAATYDKPEGERSAAAAVTAFNAITGKDLTESHGWLFLQLLKDVRLFQRAGYHADSAEDCIAYAALKAEAKAKGV